MTGATAGIKSYKDAWLIRTSSPAIRSTGAGDLRNDPDWLAEQADKPYARPW